METGFRFRTAVELEALCRDHHLSIAEAAIRGEAQQGALSGEAIVEKMNGDPIGGYVEAPCMMRNGLFGLHAFGAAAVSLSGVRSIVPFDQVVAALREVGNKMPRIYKETAEGGLAATPAGLRYKPGGRSQSPESMPAGGEPADGSAWRRDPGSLPKS